MRNDTCMWYAMRITFSSLFSCFIQKKNIREKKKVLRLDSNFLSFQLPFFYGSTILKRWSKAEKNFSSLQKSSSCCWWNFFLRKKGCEVGCWNFIFTTFTFFFLFFFTSRWNKKLCFSSSLLSLLVL